jgi:AcrR family transcriptional regulator
MPPALTETQPAPIEPLYRQLQPRWCRLDHDGVADNQRLRLIGAMVEVAGSKAGYAVTNIKLLSALAGVSRQTFYDRFGTTEACFLATYEYVVGRAARHVGVAYQSKEDWEAKLRAAFDAYASEVLSEPKAARIALVEVLGAGPAALAESDRGRQAFEQMISASFGQAPDGVTLPPLIVKGIVCGVERITRQRLLAGSVEELPALADELLSWTHSYRSRGAARLAAASPAQNRRAPCCPRARAESDRARILRSAAQIVAAKGYARLTPAQIVCDAGLSEERFHQLFESTEQCFLDALDRLGLEALVCVSRASRGSEDWLVRLHSGMAALMQHLAANPALVRVAFVEVFALGPAGIKRRERLLGQFTDLLAKSVPRSHRPSDLVAEASVGAICGIVHYHVTRGGTYRLSGLADYATYIALAPVIGGEAAVQVILADEEAQRACPEAPQTSSPSHL